jgi:hypothetical protein
LIEMEIISKGQTKQIEDAIKMLDKLVTETRKKSWESSRLNIHGMDACNLGTLAERANVASESLFQVLNCASAYFACPNAKAALDERHKVYDEAT